MLPLPPEKKTPADPIRRMFDRSIMKQDSLNDLMAQLRSAVKIAEEREQREAEEAERR